MNKIFVIGPNKCGTTSIHNFFVANGITSKHWDGGRLAQRIVSNFSSGLNALEGYQDYTAFSDIVHLSRHEYLSPVLAYNLLSQSYPDGIYILNIRSYSDWLASRENHRGDQIDRGGIAPRLASALGKKYDPEKEFQSYLRIMDFPPKHFHLFNLDNSNAFEDLAIFLRAHGFDIKHSKPNHANKSRISKTRGYRLRSFVRDLILKIKP